MVQVKDPDGNADTATVTINISDVKETSKIVVTYAETGSGSQNWTNPSGTLYTNENSRLMQWTADGEDRCEGARQGSCGQKNHKHG